MCNVLSTFNSSTVTVLRVRILGQYNGIVNRTYEGWILFGGLHVYERERSVS